MKKTFKYNIRASKQAFIKAEEVINLCRVLYNLALEQRIWFYKQRRKSVSKYEQMRQLPELKKSFPEFKEIPSQSAQDVIERLDKAFQGFFQRVQINKNKAGFPRFKAMNRYHSFTLKQSGWKIIDKKYLVIPKIGRFKIRLSRPIEGIVKTVTITKTFTGKWFAMFSCDNVSNKPLPKTGKSVGIDVGCKSFLTDSNGKKIDNPRFFKKSEDILAKRQQSLATKKKSSNNRYKAKILVAKAHEKIKNQRNDFHFKVANQLVKENDAIYVEKLNTWDTGIKRINKSMRDVAWFDFFGILNFKAAEAEKRVIKVPAKGTSQICSNCGKTVPKDLSIRVHNCTHCKLSIDRDFNAAINIKKLGQSFVA